MFGRNVRVLNQPEPGPYGTSLVPGGKKSQKRKRRQIDIDEDDEDYDDPMDRDDVYHDITTTTTTKTLSPIDDDDDDGDNEKSEEDIYSIDRYQKKKNGDDDNNDNDDDNDFVYDTLNTDVYGTKDGISSVSTIDDKGIKRVFNKNGLIKSVYNKEKNNGSSMWRRKILELISRQKSEVYQFALMLSNMIDENIDFVLNEFPKNYITPNMQIKNLLEDLLKKLPNSRSPQEWNQTQIIIRSILASIKQFSEEVYDKDDHYTRKKGDNINNNVGRRKKGKGSKTSKEYQQEKRNNDEWISTSAEGEIENDNDNNEKEEEQDEIVTYDYNEQEMDEIEDYYKDETNNESNSKGFPQLVEWLNDKVIIDLDRIIQNITGFVDRQQLDKYIYIGMDMYEKITRVILLVLKNVSECMVKLHNVSEEESQKMYKYMESYIHLQKTFENDKMMPLTFMDSIVQIVKEIIDLIKRIPRNHLHNHSEYYRLIQKKLSEFRSKFTRNKLVELVRKFDFQQAERNYSLELNLQKKSDVSELLQVLNQIDNSGQLDKKFISPWADDESTLAIVFFSDNIYGIMLMALNNINIFSNNDFKMMELITTPKISAVFAKYVAHLFTSSKLNKRQKTTTSKYAITYDSTRFQLIENHNITKSVSVFFKTVKRITFKDQDTGKTIGSKLVSNPQSHSIIGKIL